MIQNGLVLKQNDSQTKSPYCLMPWLHFHVGNKGMVNACCVGNIPLGNINEKSFDEIWMGEPIAELRKQFLRQEPDPRCKVCIHREAAGVKSMREETFEKFADFNISQFQLPIYFDIRFSNVCNFRCRTCWHGASSKWYKDAKSLGRAIGHEAILKNVNDFKGFIAKMGPSLKMAQEIYFAGGEPLVTEEHYLLLDWLIEHKVYPKLRYNTNFSVLKFKKWDVIKLWKEFPSVEILASIDAANNLGEYIRKEFDWELFLENREKIRSLNSVSFKVAPTVSILNVKDLPFFYTQLIANGVIAADDWYTNVLERPYYYNIKALPADIKQEIKQVYQTFIQNLKPNQANVKQQFTSIIDFMMVEDLSSYYQQFIKETEKLDELRNEDGSTFNFY